MQDCCFCTQERLNTFLFSHQTAIIQQIFFIWFKFSVCLVTPTNTQMNGFNCVAATLWVLKTNTSCLYWNGKADKLFFISKTNWICLRETTKRDWIGRRKKNSIILLFFFVAVKCFGIEASSQLQEVYKELVKAGEKGREANEAQLKWMCGLCSRLHDSAQLLRVLWNIWIYQWLQS